MSISRLAALQIKNNKVVFKTSGPTKDTGKYIGWIYKDDKGKFPFFNTDDDYDTEADALAFLTNLVKEIKALTSDEIFDRTR